MIINVNDLIEQLQEVKDKTKPVYAVASKEVNYIAGLVLSGEVFEVSKKDSYVELVLTD